MAAFEQIPALAIDDINGVDQLSAQDTQVIKTAILIMAMNPN